MHFYSCLLISKSFEPRPMNNKELEDFSPGGVSKEQVRLSALYPQNTTNLNLYLLYKFHIKCKICLQNDECGILRQFCVNYTN